MKTYNNRPDPNGLRVGRKKWTRLASSLMTVVLLSLSFSGQAAARIIFEDDTYFTVNSEGIILDYNDNADVGTAATATSEGGTYTADAVGAAGNSIDVIIVDGANCDIASADCTTVAGNVITITADLSDANGDDTDDDPVTSAMIVAEVNADAEASALITGSSGDGTAVSAGTINLATGTDGQNIDLQFGNDSTDALIRYNDTTQDITLSTPGGDFDFSDDNITTTGGALFSGASEFHIREVANETAASCGTVGEIVLDTGENRIYVCTATGAPGTWTASDSGSSQDFDDVYDISQSGANLTMEIDNGSLNFNITTADSFTIQDGGTAIAEFTGTGAVEFDPTSGQNFDVTTAGVGDILFTASDTFDVNATGAVGIDSDAAVTIGGASIGLTADGGILSLTGDGTNDIDILNTGAAIDIDGATLDALLTGVFSIDGTGASNVSATSGNLTLSTITSGDVDITAATDVDITGATNVDVVSTSGDITLTSGDDIIFDDAQLTGAVQLSVTATDWALVFPTDGIIDNINAFTTTNNGEGASLVGIEDVGTYFTGTDVEAALQELGASVSINGVDLTFYPEYPDTVIYQDGSNNRGTLESFYDATQDSSYYNWVSRLGTLQDINIQFHFVLPPDFSAIGTNGLQFQYRTGTAATANNRVDLEMFEVVTPGTTVTSCGSDTTNANGAVTFATGQITKATIDGACTLTAGDLILIEVKLYDNNIASTYADVGYITLDYDN